MSWRLSGTDPMRQSIELGENGEFAPFISQRRKADEAARASFWREVWRNPEAWLKKEHAAARVKGAAAPESRTS